MNTTTSENSFGKCWYCGEYHNYSPEMCQDMTKRASTSPLPIIKLDDNKPIYNEAMNVNEELKTRIRTLEEKCKRYEDALGDVELCARDVKRLQEEGNKVDILPQYIIDIAEQALKGESHDQP